MPNENESYSTEGPECPSCGFTFTPDEPHYFDETGYTEETCQDCGSKFRVEVFHTVSWSCELIEPQPIAAKPL